VTATRAVDAGAKGQRGKGDQFGRYNRAPDCGSGIHLLFVPDAAALASPLFRL
jgi:hypothetical protein